VGNGVGNGVGIWPVAAYPLCTKLRTFWSRWSGLNRQPTVDKIQALRSIPFHTIPQCRNNEVSSRCSVPYRSVSFHRIAATFAATFAATCVDQNNIYANGDSAQILVCKGALLAHVALNEGIEKGRDRGPPRVAG